MATPTYEEWLKEGGVDVATPGSQEYYNKLYPSQPLKQWTVDELQKLSKDKGYFDFAKQAQLDADYATSTDTSQQIQDNIRKQYELQQDVINRQEQMELGSAISAGKSRISGTQRALAESQLGGGVSGVVSTVDLDYINQIEKAEKKIQEDLRQKFSLQRSQLSAEQIDKINKEITDSVDRQINAQIKKANLLQTLIGIDKTQLEIEKMKQPEEIEPPTPFFTGTNLISLMADIPIGETREIQDPNTGETYTLTGTKKVENAETEIVQQLIQKYPDAMISMADNLATAQQKLLQSNIYKQATRLSGSGGGSGGGGTTETATGENTALDPYLEKDENNNWIVNETILDAFGGSADDKKKLYQSIFNEANLRNQSKAQTTEQTQQESPIENEIAYYKSTNTDEDLIRQILRNKGYSEQDINNSSAGSFWAKTSQDIKSWLNW